MGSPLAYSILANIFMGYHKKDWIKKAELVKPTFLRCLSLFLIAIWLPHSQLWVIIEGCSLTHPMLITAFLYIRQEDHWEPSNAVGNLVTS